MRCIACNKNLNDYESTAKSATTGEYLDTCRKCLSGLDIKLVKNKFNPNEESPFEIDEFTEDDYQKEDDTELLDE